MNSPFISPALCKLDVNLYFSNYNNLFVIVMSCDIFWSVSTRGFQLAFQAEIGPQTVKAGRNYDCCRNAMHLPTTPARIPMAKMRWNPKHATRFACSEFVISTGMPSNFITIPLIDFLRFRFHSSWSSKQKAFQSINRCVVVIVEGM